MPNSVESEIESGYEKRSREKIRSTLTSCFGVHVFEPSYGFNRKFWKSDLGDFWPVAVSEPVEVDFIGKTNDLIDVPPGPFAHPDNKYISGTVSSCRSSSLAKTVVPSCASGRYNSGSPAIKEVRYVIGEVTHGGKKATISKLHQLEKDCQICMAKLRVHRVLEAVAIAVVVNPLDFSTEIFDAIQSNPESFPHLTIIFEAGRLIYLQYTETVSVMLTDAQQELMDLREQYQADITIVRDDLNNLRDDLNNVTEQVKSMREESNRKFEELTKGITTILNHLAK